MGIPLTLNLELFRTCIRQFRGSAAEAARWWGLKRAGRGGRGRGRIRQARLLYPVDVEVKAEPYLIEITPKATLPAHFFFHKGEEVGYVLSGRLQVRVGKGVHNLKTGDVIYLTSEIPGEWRNPGPSVARLLWVKVK